MKKHKIIIIGGGIAGLSAGVYAQKNGFDTTVVEMHEKPGGQLTAWERNGYRFDFCLNWLVGTSSGPFHQIWKEIGAIDQDTQILNQKIFIRLVDKERGDFYIYNDLDEWERYLMAIAPEDKNAIEKLCQMMRKSYQLEPFEEPPEMRNVFDYIKSFWKMGSFFPVLIKYGKRTSDELFESLHFTNENLLFFLNQLFGGTDFSALGFLMMMGWAHAKNSGYVLGGSYEMTERISQKFCSLGGKFMLNTKVEEIIVENDEAKGVLLENGQELQADHIISACDLHTVIYKMLKGQYVPTSFEQAFLNWPLFTPLVMVGFGINEKIESKSHNTRYLTEELYIGGTKVEGYSISDRSSYDPIFSPEGKSTLLMLFESPWENWQALSGDEYLIEKAQIKRDCLALLEKHYPSIKEKVEVIDIATPKTTVHFTGVWKGAYEGFLPSHDVLNGLPMKLEGLANFTLIGQWLFPGGGLPPSAQSGKWAIQLLTKEEKNHFLVE